MGKIHSMAKRNFVSYSLACITSVVISDTFKTIQPRSHEILIILTKQPQKEHCSSNKTPKMYSSAYCLVPTSKEKLFYHNDK